MNAQLYMQRMKEIQNNLLEFLENDELSDESYKSLQKLLENRQQSYDPYELKSILYLINNIVNNHFCGIPFFAKAEQILQLLSKQIKQFFTNSDIFNIFMNNKRILLFLFEEKILFIDDHILSELIRIKKGNYTEYFNPEIKLFEGCEIEKDDSFYEKRKIGKNDKYLYKLIQQDQIDDFIVFVNQSNISIKDTKIESTIYETNPFLIENEPNLIEYSAFYGSIQIFKYLFMNNVRLTPSLYLYAIHGNNPEILQFLEENKITPEDRTYKKCLKESIKCHHHNFTDYFLDNLADLSNLYFNFRDFNDNYLSYCFEYYNFSYFPETLNELCVLDYACKYDYYVIVNSFMETISADEINSMIILLFLNPIISKKNLKTVSNTKIFMIQFFV
ncbi:hypothetical protein M9Y10_037123 [Tritrichomonas musculus]|uniref:DUF3447 domain-containing protein n=1 Tax=Tritrichomonas musculus TaxID=1915356 RepID=A0ABR2GT04_9EUKA